MPSKDRIQRINDEILTSLDQFTLPQILTRQAEQLGSTRTAIRHKAYGLWETCDWKTYSWYTRLTALGLLSLGLRREEPVGFILENQPEWLFSQLGAQSLGCVALPLFPSSGAKELVQGLNRIQAAFVFVQDQEQVDKLLFFRKELSHVRRIIYIDPTGMRPYRDDPWLISFSQLLELGEEQDREKPDLFIKELWDGNPEDLALMLLTSGTTGDPKLVMLTHANFTDMAFKWISTEPLGVEDNWISMMPAAWIVEQMWGVGIALCGGLVMNFPESPDTVMEDLREIGPTVMVSSSRFWEQLASRIQVKMHDAGFLQERLYHFAQKVGARAAELELNGNKLPTRLKVLRWMVIRLVSHPLMDRVGCLHVRVAYSGGHPISPDVIRFFRSNGLNLKQCYGTTETCGIFQVQPDGEVKPETVGRPLPGTEVMLAQDQEVLVRSKSNFLGYFQNPKETEEVLRAGWFHTGDVAHIDEEGHLLIIGRKDELMRTLSGEIISPDFIETKLKFSPYIKEAVICGEGRPYVTALIDMDLGNVLHWAGHRRISHGTHAELSRLPAVQGLIRGEVAAVNARLTEPMKIEKIILLYKTLEVGDEDLTRTGKVKRKIVYQQYQELVEAMYTDKKDLPIKTHIRCKDGTIAAMETTIRILFIR